MTHLETLFHCILLEKSELFSERQCLGDSPGTMMVKDVSSAVIRYSSELNILATYLSCLKKISVYSNGY